MTSIFKIIIVALIVTLLGATFPIQAQDGPSQAGINQYLDDLEMQYGITAAFPAEWQAQTAGEVVQLYDGLANIMLAFDLTAQTLWELNGSPADMTPQEHFRFYFDRANLSLDRTGASINGFAGNTAPQYENGRIIGYMIQMSPVGLSQPFTFAHEIGHVLDNMLGDVPQRDHLAELGGLVGDVGWIPGAGFEGNEVLFPRANSGLNEDYADTFGNMMIGNLSPDNTTSPRYIFMVEHVPRWLLLIRIRGAINTDSPLIAE